MDGSDDALALSIARAIANNSSTNTSGTRMARVGVWFHLARALALVRAWSLRENCIEILGVQLVSVVYAIKEVENQVS
jgi:hypothetical protein